MVAKVVAVMECVAVQGSRILYGWQKEIVKKWMFPFAMCKISRYFAQILKIAMNQQEIRSKYYLHSDVFHLESTYFFSFLQKRYHSSLVMR